jgi:hypothetical protein
MNEKMNDGVKKRRQEQQNDAKLRQQFVLGCDE